MSGLVTLLAAVATATTAAPVDPFALPTGGRVEPQTRTATTAPVTRTATTSAPAQPTEPESLPPPSKIPPQTAKRPPRPAPEPDPTEEITPRDEPPQFRLRSPWDARPPLESLSTALFIGFSTRSAEDGLVPNVGVTLRWTIFDALTLRLDGHGFPPGARLTPVYTLIDGPTFGWSVTAPATFLSAGRFSYTGFGVGTEATLSFGPITATGRIDGSWLRTFEGVQDSVGSRDQGALGVRPGAFIDVDTGPLRVGLAVESQLFTTESGVVATTSYIAIEL